MLDQKVFNVVKSRNADSIARYGRLPDAVSARDEALEDYELGLPRLSMEAPVPPGSEEDAEGQIVLMLAVPKRCDECGAEMPASRIFDTCGPCVDADIREMVKERLWVGVS